MSKALVNNNGMPSTLEAREVANPPSVSTTIRPKYASAMYKLPLLLSIFKPNGRKDSTNTYGTFDLITLELNSVLIIYSVGHAVTLTDQHFVEDLTAKGVGLCVADAHTGNHREDDLTPLEIIRRFLDIIGSKSLSSSKGRASSRRGGASQTCTLTKDELSQLVADYDIPRNVKVLLPKRSQTIFDAPLGFVGLYTHHFTLLILG
ncbi:hypothetical protein Tco_1207569, partial [Tanacetum coccineum]